MPCLTAFKELRNKSPLPVVQNKYLLVSLKSQDHLHRRLNVSVAQIELALFVLAKVLSSLDVLQSNVNSDQRRLDHRIHTSDNDVTQAFLNPPCL